jgi:hypothetical protein
MYVCMYVYMYDLYVCMYELYVCMYVCMYDLYVCMYEGMIECMYVASTADMCMFIRLESNELASYRPRHLHV